jgi:hypothetical protein
VNGFREQLAAAVGAVAITSEVTFAWFGAEEGRLPARVERSMSADTARGYLAYNLQARLYGDFYCRGAAVPGDDRRARVSPDGSAALVEALSAVNHGSGCWQPGWSVRAEHEDELDVEYDGLTLVAAPGQYRRGDGTAASVRLPREMLRSSPGFYSALGDVALVREHALLRVYWNLSAAGAVAFVEGGTRLFNEAGLPMRLKVANEPSRFDRCDAGVLYIRRADAADAWDLLDDLHGALAPWLGGATPALTKAVAPGVGVAEDPGGGESFGLHRCGLVAEALIRAAERGVDAVERRLELVEERFEEAGLSLAAPYLSPGSVDAYPSLAGIRGGRLRRAG